ncbi:hypothetical protein KFE25_006493 [Diacronema lutheri]|uniref:Uncharacterized protein n=2 Tax=Diacronema lutheri TaxID=2081491 RepID=A0A8J5XQX3_DIALT|nr:hypothetical protein KFE25_006493 [Diacronema lutheri]
MARQTFPALGVASAGSLALALLVLLRAERDATLAPGALLCVRAGAISVGLLLAGYATWAAWLLARSVRAVEPLMLTTPIELWFVRHAQSLNNEMSEGMLGKLAYVACNACLSARDPQITAEGMRGCAAAARWLARRKEDAGQEGVHFDLVVSSVMQRAMLTAMHTFCDAGLADEIVVAPFISETPLWLLCYPRVSNMPLGRAQQLDELRHTRRIHADGRVPLDFSLVGGEAGDNRACLPPSMPRFLRWLWAQPRVQELVRERRLTGGLVRIAVVSHGTFLRQALRLRKHPRNNSVCTARLQVGVPEEALGVSEPRCARGARKLRVRLTEAEVVHAGVET